MFPIPAAQYLRMSTEHQQYSLQNQMAAIQQYAESHGFAVIQTYSDAAKSGLVLKRRSGLRQLLRDVVGGSAAFRVILVTTSAVGAGSKTVTRLPTTSSYANPLGFRSIIVPKPSRTTARCRV